jgi:hypothetical protein
MVALFYHSCEFSRFFPPASGQLFGVDNLNPTLRHKPSGEYNNISVGKLGHGGWNQQSFETRLTGKPAERLG